VFNQKYTFKLASNQVLLKNIYTFSLDNPEIKNIIDEGYSITSVNKKDTYHPHTLNEPSIRTGENTSSFISTNPNTSNSALSSKMLSENLQDVIIDDKDKRQFAYSRGSNGYLILTDQNKSEYIRLLDPESLPTELTELKAKVKEWKKTYQKLAFEVGIKENSTLSSQNEAQSKFKAETKKLIQEIAKYVKTSGKYGFDPIFYDKMKALDGDFIEMAKLTALQINKKGEVSCSPTSFLIHYILMMVIDTLLLYYTYNSLLPGSLVLI